MRFTLIPVAVLYFITAPGLNGFAQQFENGIHASGSVVLERPAERMRMQIDLLAKSAKGLPDALVLLKERRIVAEKQLEKLGAIKGSASFGEPKVEDPQSDPQRQMQMMIMHQMAQRQGRNAGVDEAKAAQPVKVSIKLTAEWSFKSADTAGRLVEASTLQETIKAADLAGLKEVEEMTPEEAELAEEIENNAGPIAVPAFAVPLEAYGSVSLPQVVQKVGEPTFVYVASIPEADREKAMAGAFKSAKTDASRLCKAAGIQLGGLRTLRSADNSALDVDDQFDRSTISGQIPGNLINSTGETLEAIGTTPGVLKYRVGVTVSFSINSTGNEPVNRK